MGESIKLIILTLVLANCIMLETKPTSSLESQTCWAYKCGTSLTSGTCVYPQSSNTTYLLSSCNEASPYCDTSILSSNISCSSKAPSTSLISYPGEECSSSSDCVYGSCINKACFSGVLNSTCTTNLQCNPGLRCSSSVCMTLIREGGSCSSDYDCVLHTGCNKGVCTKYLSLPVGSSVSDCTNGDKSSIFCSDFSCNYNKTSKMGTCIAPFTGNGTAVTCTSYKNCVGTSVNAAGNYTKTTSCECGMNANRNLYCFPQDADLVSQAFREVWRKFMNAGLLGKCNTQRRFHQECIDLSSDSWRYKGFMKAYYEYFYHSQLLEADSCTVAVFFPLLSEAWSLAVSVLAIVAFC